ncbi:MAG: GMC family oxidoreductase [Polyangiaceae bacterium]|nr:GMC family oxidoreductase [Polyangiaceae bacterium]
MTRVDGRDVRAPLSLEADVVIVGSGPAGAAAAREAARLGASTLVLEEGRWFAPGEFPLSSFDAMAASYRDMGASVVLGAAPTPYVQGRMVGGSSPINGAICWRLPRDVYDEWVTADPALGDALPFDEIERTTSEVEARLEVRPTDPSVAGAKNQLLARGAEALGLAHRPIRRNVSACEGLGRCMQGCPGGRKLSVDATLLTDAERDGATVASSIEVTRVTQERGRATGVVGVSAGGARVTARARRAVVLAASAVQTPALLLKSGLSRGPVGHHFQCHPGVSMAGRFPEPVRMWEGATQGHEVTGLRHEGLKFEALGFGLAVMSSRLPGVGRAFAREVDDLAHQLDWGAAVRAEAEGRVRVVAERTVVTFTPTARDVARYRRGLRVLGEMMLAAGADHVAPGVRGFAPRVTSVRELLDLERSGPTSAAAYTAAITHMFGTCRMGSRPRDSVVGLDFAHHDAAGLYVADSSVFPSNLGVNPQVPIMAVATLAARRAVGAVDPTPPTRRRLDLT